MGIPSPFNAPASSPLLRLKPTSPDLPLLQALEELNGERRQAFDDLDLLPVASVDLAPSCGALDERLSWADCKVDEARDSDDGQQEGPSESSTALPRDCDSLETQSTGSQTKALCGDSSTPEADYADTLQVKGAIKVDASHIAPPCSAATAPSMDAQSVIVQLLCRSWTDGSSGMMITPCCGDDVGSGADAFWCCVQTQQDGSVLIAPCTDAASCGVTTDAAGMPLENTEEVVGAPSRPPLGSYAPTWVYGATWPFCVAPTTLVLSNLPDDLLQEDLIEVLDKSGFGCFYDFIYLPMDHEFQRNLGYAIVNLTRHEYGLALAASVYGRSSWCGTITSECQVSWSIPLQGVSQLTEHYRDHPACRENVPTDMRPTYFAGGFPRPFP